MKEEIRDGFLRWFTIALLALVVFGGAAMVYPSYDRGQKLKRQEAELRERIKAKQVEIEKLLECQRRFKSDPDFVETIARQNGRVFPGELVFIFED